MQRIDGYDRCLLARRSRSLGIGHRPGIAQPEDIGIAIVLQRELIDIDIAAFGREWAFRNETGGFLRGNDMDHVELAGDFTLFRPEGRSLVAAIHRDQV